MAVPFAGVNRPKLMKRMASQQTRDNQQRRGDRAARLLVEKPPHLAEFHGFRHRLGFERALRFVLRGVSDWTAAYNASPGETLGSS